MIWRCYCNYGILQVWIKGSNRNEPLLVCVGFFIRISGLLSLRDVKCSPMALRTGSSSPIDARILSKCFCCHNCIRHDTLANAWSRQGLEERHWWQGLARHLPITPNIIPVWRAYSINSAHFFKFTIVRSFYRMDLELPVSWLAIRYVCELFDVSDFQCDLRADHKGPTDSEIEAICRELVRSFKAGFLGFVFSNALRPCLKLCLCM